jgi:xanthine dehydrogenase accessory factor
VTRDARAELIVGRSGVRHYGPDGQGNPEPDADDTVHVFIESFAPPPKMIIFGAVDFTAALAKVAKVLGYNVTVCDARPVFATTKRFPMADEVICDWPNRVMERVGPTLGPRDAVCVLTHDPKFDVPAIQGALGSNVGYLGVMGSRKTHAKRLDRLAEVGVTAPADLDRILAPVGLDIGARSPEETAISICAEIIARHTGRIAPSLRDATGPIH